MSKKLFDFAIGNPPYQESNPKSTRQNPVYNLFMDEAFGVADCVEVITPARYLFDAGQTPKAWNEKMLNDEHFKVLHYEENSAAIFPSVEIKGGVAITIRDENKNYGKIGVFTKYDQLNGIIHAVVKDNFESMESIVSSRGCYRFTDSFFKDYPNAGDALKSGTGNMVVSNIFTRVPEAFSDTPESRDCVKIIGREKNKRTAKYIDKKYIIDNGYVTTYNVLISEANNTGEFGETLVEPSLLAPMEAATDTFISIGFFETKEESVNATSYLRTKFCRAMLGVKKATQHTAKSVWEYVPLQDFTANSDIDWSKSIPEIDRQLYAKYGLSTDEIEFIESHVKEMI